MWEHLVENPGNSLPHGIGLVHRDEVVVSELDELDGGGDIPLLVVQRP